jgi:antitoxin ParD1/3/4
MSHCSKSSHCSERRKSAILDLIRREQQRGAEIAALRQALIEGEESGEPQPFDFDAFKALKVAP